MGVEGGVRVFVETEDVTVMPETMTLKLRIEGCVGRVSATKVKLRLPVPPPPPQPTVQTPPLGPLQPAKEKLANQRTERNERALLRFI